MSIQDATHRFSAWRNRMQMWWITVAAFAIVLAFADGFWVTSLQGTVGAIERSEPPFHRWLRDSTLMVPLFILAVLAALLMARRVVGHRRGLVKFGVTALMITVLGSGVAIAELGASSGYDYHLQTQHLQTEQLLHHSHLTVAQTGGTIVPVTGSCTGICASERDTFNAHLRAVLYGSIAVLITNLVLVTWVMALRSERLWRRPVRSPKATSPVAPQELSLV